jgi:hypothetical protein
MAHIQAPVISWLDEAWRISAVIADLPDNPPGLFSSSSKWPPLQGGPKLLIELLQDKIALHLAYRSRMVHKNTETFPDGEKALISPPSRDPVDTAKLLIAFGKTVKLLPVDLWAYDAHMKLGRILIDRYVCKEWKQRLPLIVASISGETTSETAKLKAKQPRVRRMTLRAAKFETHRCNPEYSFKQLLTSLEGDGIVTRWDDNIIKWVDEDGTTKATKTGTFKNWKSKK